MIRLRIWRIGACAFQIRALILYTFRNKDVLERMPVGIWRLPGASLPYIMFALGSLQTSVLLERPESWGLPPHD